MNKGLFSPDAFDHESSHGPEDPPLRHRVTSIWSNEELARLDPSGLQVGQVLDYKGLSLPAGATTVAPAPFARCGAGRIDADPEEDYLIADFDTGVSPSRFLIQSLRPDGAWEQVLELFVPTTIPPRMATGDVDEDGLDEIAVVWDDAQGIHLGVFDDGLLIHQTPLFCYTGSSNDVDREGIELGLADLDGDGADEIVTLGNRGPGGPSYFFEPDKGPLLNVFDDAGTGFALLVEDAITRFSSEAVGGVGTEGNRARLVLGDFFESPGRGMDEIALTRLVYSDAYGHDHDTLWLQYETLVLTDHDGVLGLHAWRQDGPDTDEYHLIYLHAGLGYPGTIPPEEDLVDFDVIAADLNGDRYDELVSTWFTVGSGGSWMNPAGPGHFVAFNIVLDQPKDEIEDLWAVPGYHEHLPSDFPQEWDGTALNRVGSFAYSDRLHDPIPENGPWPDFRASLWSLAAGDGNASNRDDLHVSAWDGDYSSMPVFHSMIEVEEDQAPYSLSWKATWSLQNHAAPPRLLFADWDNDDYSLRYTGKMELTLGDPVPIILMAAPPWKKGTSQNCEESYTEYSYAHGQGTTHSVTNGMTASVWVGYEVNGPFDLFSASGKVVWESEYAWTQEETNMVSYSTYFATPYDKDVIVFQGTLYESYEYEVLSAPDPGVLGKLLTIDLPVASKRYVWTLGLFNKFMDPSNAIQPSILGHSIGSPATYLTEEQAQSMVTATAHTPGQGYVGWMTPTAVPLVMHSGSSAAEIQLSQHNVLLEERSWSVTAEQEYKAGAVVAGFSVGLFGAQVYGVECSKQDVYHGRVGGIPDPGEYADWCYDFGLVVYNRGLYLDNGVYKLEPGELPFQVETYYTDPFGEAY